MVLPELDRELRERERKYLDDVAGRLVRERPGSVGSALLVGDRVSTLCTYAAETGADLVVMTTHGRGGIERMWLGSVADGLVRHLHIPMLLVRPIEAVPATERPFRLRRVVVPLDGSPSSERILEHAAALGRPGETRYRLVRVLSPSLVIGGYVLRLDEERLREISRKAESELREVARRFERDGFDADHRVLVNQSPVVAILGEVEDIHADLIAMTTHGRGGMRRWMLGSVADKVVRGSSVPVLLFRPPE